VINLADNGQSDGCPSIPDYPFDVKDLAAAYYHGNIVACGGYDGLRQSPFCYSLGPELNAWNEMDSLPDGPRERMASSIIDGKWLITGGYNPRNPSSGNAYKTTVVYDGVQFTSGPELPVVSDDHCQLTLNSTHVFLVTGDKDTFTLNWETQEYVFYEKTFIEMPSSACGLLNNDNYGSEVLIASRAYSYIFSLTDHTWRDGPKLPEEPVGPVSAPAPYGFVSIGGFLGDFLLADDSVYNFDEDLYEWALQKAELKIARFQAAAVAVPENFLNCS